MQADGLHCANDQATAMRISLRKKRSGEIEFGIIFGSLALIALVAARYLPLMDVMPSCLFKEFTGFPCPTRGDCTTTPT